MDDVIFEEFKGTGNMELVLDRKIADRRVYPAIDIFRSGTRKEELLLTQPEINRAILLRQFLADMPEAEAIEFLLRQMAKSKNNKEFFTQWRRGRMNAALARFLAVDYGRKRIGLAISDTIGMIATPAGFIERREGKRAPITKIIARAASSRREGSFLAFRSTERATRRIGPLK